MRERCIVCKTERLGEWHGRIIDGSWAYDSQLKKDLLGAWVCSWHCYSKLLQTAKEEEDYQKPFRRKGTFILKRGIPVGHRVYQCPFCGAHIVKGRVIYMDFGRCPHVVGMDSDDGIPLFSDKPREALRFLLELEGIDVPDEA